MGKAGADDGADPVSTGGPAEIRRRSVTIAGHRTSVSVENIFWSALKDIVRAEGISVNRLVARIDESRTGNLSSAIRVFVMERLSEKRCASDTHQGADDSTRKA